MDLFDDNIKKFAPLADRLRPTELKDFIGQEHLVYDNSLLVRAIKASTIGSCIFWGPPGTGKTTIANIIANSCNGIFKKLNAVSSGVGDAKEIIAQAKSTLQLYGKKTFLLLDECHRWSKAQSDCVLEAIETGCIVFIGSTTENPYINMTRAIVSRCQVFEFKPLSKENVIKALNNAVENKEKGYGNINVKLLPEASEHLAWASAGDLRSAYNALELAVKTTPANAKGEIVIDKKVAEECIQKREISLDENTSFDMLSAFCKSLRGSDADAALFWAQKLLLSGFDPLILARRLVAHASEDVGMADSNAVLLALSALQSCEKLGMPECNLTLCHAIIYICEAEKSNSVCVAMNEAMADAENYKDAVVPNHLKNHPTGYSDGHGKYKYPHDFGGYVKQQYLPDVLKDKIYYKPLNNGREKGMLRKKFDSRAKKG
mgnify:CR=1 FL=1